MNIMEYRELVKQRIMDIKECSEAEAERIANKWVAEIVDAYELDNSEESADDEAKEIVAYDF